MNQNEAEALHPYYTEFPKRLGPPPVPPYKGTEYLNAREPAQTITFDAGAFRAVWELLEAEAKVRYPTKGTMKWAQALCRAVESLREAYWKENNPPDTPALTPAKKTQAPSEKKPGSPGPRKMRRIKPSGSGPRS